MSKTVHYQNVKCFIEQNFRHFNAKTLVEASKEYVNQLKEGNKMLITLAGAMSTAEIGLTLADMIRENKVHAISCTAANLEEDIFNLVAHDSYKRIENWRALSIEDETALLEKGLNRVTDTCIPEDEAMRKIEHHILQLWQKADKENKRYFPYEFFYELIDSKLIEKEYQIDPKNSWVIAAKEKNLPIITPGYEDSTLANMFVSNIINQNIKNINIIKSGLEQMEFFVDWYKKTTANCSIGFFQIGGGIAGDFPICVVPLLTQDLKLKAKKWSYFCQISDSTTSFGSYSGAVPNEKISWGKLDGHTPKFMIESDATIVAPLMFAYILGQ